MVGYADHTNIIGKMKRATYEVYKELKEKAKK
jgi:hypothetical protein